MKRFIESDNNFVKRLKIERLNVSKNPFIRTDDSDLIVYTNIDYNYVQIGRYIYKVLPISDECVLEYGIVSETAIGLTQYQHQTISSYINNNILSISNFTETVYNIDSLTINLTSINTFPMFIDIMTLTKLIRNIMDDNIIYVDQEIPAKMNNLDITLVINKLSNSRYGKITNDTNINIETLNTNINIYNQCLSISNDSISVTIDKCYDISSLDITQIKENTRFPLVISQDVLTKHIKLAFKDIFLNNGTLVYKCDGYEFTFNIKILDLDKNAKYPNIYKLLDNDNNLIRVASSISHVIVTRDNSVADKIYFNLEKSPDFSYTTSDLILYQDKLVDYVKNNITSVVKNQTFVYPHNSKNVILSVARTMPHKEIETIYEINSNTKFTFINKIDNNIDSAIDSVMKLFNDSIKIICSTKNKTPGFIVVNNSTPSDLENIVFKINENIKHINFIKLMKIIKKFFPKQTSLGHHISIPYKDSDLTLIVKEMDFVDKNIVKNINKCYLGLITDNTKFHIDVTDDNRPIIDKETEKEKDNILENPIGELEKNIGGITDQIKTVVRNICLSRGKLRKEFNSRGLKATKGIIMYGAPGTGKTLLARNIGKLLGCTEENNRLRLMNGPEIFQEFIGNSEKNIREIFAPAKKAWKKHGEDAPTYMVCIDEIDAILAKRTNTSSSAVRDSVVNQFIGEMDGLEQFNNLIIIGLTNRLEVLDPAVVRSGRFSIHLKFDLPNDKGRQKIFEIYTRKLNDIKRLENINMKKLIDATNNFSGADIEEVCNIASILSLDRLDKMNLDDYTEQILNEHSVVTENDFIRAITQVKETMNKDNKNTMTQHMYI